LPNSSEASAGHTHAPSPAAVGTTSSQNPAKSALKHSYVLGDQAIVSGSNFLTSIALARGLSLSDFGQYSLIWMSVLFGINVQLAFITSPMMSVGPLQRRFSQATYLGCVAVHQLLFTAASSLLLTTLLLFLCLAIGVLPASLMLPLIVANLAYQLQDFGRRTLFYLDKPVAATLNDCISYLGQLGLIAVYFFRHHLTVALALWITGLTSLAALLVAIPLLPLPVLAGPLLRVVFRRNWKSARYLIGATVLQWTSGNLFILVSPFFLGTVAAGAMRACQTITNMTNVWLQGLENSLPSEASNKFRLNGKIGLRQYVLRSSAILGAVTAVVVIAICVAPEFWLHLIYGPHLRGYGFVLSAYALLSLGIVLTLPLRAGLRALEDTSPILWGYVATSVYSLISAPLLARYLGLSGVAWGVVGTQLLLIPLLLVALEKRLRHV
jgi:O-antigen/teichoic acid export membrane protein